MLEMAQAASRGRIVVLDVSYILPLFLTLRGVQPIRTG